MITEDATVLSAHTWRASRYNSIFSVCFNWAPRHEGVLREWWFSSTHSLTSALDGGEWPASRPGPFTSRKELIVSIGTNKCANKQTISKSKYLFKYLYLHNHWDSDRCLHDISDWEEPQRRFWSTNKINWHPVYRKSFIFVSSPWNIQKYHHKNLSVWRLIVQW
jgi:hypothetical protein